MAEGLTNREVAERMGLTPATVKTMLERMYREAGVSGRVGLLRWARPDARRGLEAPSGPDGSPGAVA